MAEKSRSGSLAMKLKMRKAYSEVCDSFIIYYNQVLFCKNTIILITIPFYREIYFDHLSLSSNLKLKKVDSNKL